TICLKCLEKDPARRYPSADALAEDLERWLRGEPIVARPVGAGERLLKWVRRRPYAAALVGVSVAAAVALVAVIGVYTFWLRETNTNLETSNDRLGKTLVRLRDETKEKETQKTRAEVKAKEATEAAEREADAAQRARDAADDARKQARLNRAHWYVSTV